MDYDDLHRAVAEADQVQALWRDYTAMLFLVYSQFRHAGFDRDQSMDLLMMHLEHRFHDDAAG